MEIEKHITEQVNWKVEGMDCANCALTISSYLKKQGMQEVKVNPVSGEVLFEKNGTGISEDSLKKGITGLGYTVLEADAPAHVADKSMNKFLRYLLICIPFTLVLMLHMLPVHIHWLMNPMAAAGTLFTCLFGGDEFLWPQCMEKPYQRYIQYECIDCAGRNRCICI